MTLTTTSSSDSAFNALLKHVAHASEIPPPMDVVSLPGMRVAPDVCLLRELAEGGMGSVWLARHKTLGRNVAVKIMKRRADPRAVHEAAVLERLRHAHIVEIYGFGSTDEGASYIVMELLEGETLSSRVKRVGRLDLEQTCTLVEQLASALSHAHAQGLVHRDIKPSNIQLADAKTIDAKLIDFGISCDAPLVTHDEVPTPSSSVAGTPQYMSPEQLRAPHMIDGRSDLWALAAVAFFALTGKRVHSGRTLQEIADQIVKPPVLPSAHVWGLPTAVDAWFKRALSVDPQARFESARAMAVALRSAIGNAGLRSRRRGSDKLLPYPLALHADDAKGRAANRDFHISRLTLAFVIATLALAIASALRYLG